MNPGIGAEGVKIISTNLLLPQDDMPVAWRGPVVTGILTQFFNQVNWSDLDYLLIDMPPGTSDTLLTVFQQMPLDGIVTVSAPQELVGMIVGKAVNLAQEMGVSVLGLVENMAYLSATSATRSFYFRRASGRRSSEEVQHSRGHYAAHIRPSRRLSMRHISAYDVKGALKPIIDALEALPEHVEGDAAAE